MKIALIGYGKMGKAVERIALRRGHEIVARIDRDNPGDMLTPAFASADVAIEFTAPSEAVGNYRRAWDAGLPVVSGTTGWTDRMDEVRREIETRDATLFWASNFSLGVNILFHMNRKLAGIMSRFPAYDVNVKEIHHTEKKDAPSGTAITLAEDIIASGKKSSWSLSADTPHDTLHIEAVREGAVPGTHIVTYTSDVDTLTIAHEAKSRDGFALGAVMAAEFTIGKKGLLGMDDMLKL